MTGFTEKQTSDWFDFGPFKFDQTGYILTRDGETLPLKRQSASVLALLIENAGSVVTRTAIRDTVWHDRTIEFDDGINACVRDIRRALGDNSKDPLYIETIPKTGYRLKAVVAPKEKPSIWRTWQFAAVFSVLFTAIMAFGITFGQAFVASNSGARDRIAVMPAMVPETAAFGQEQADRLTSQLVTMLAEHQTRLMVISVGELFADDERQPGMGDVSRWLSVDYLLAASVAADDDTKSLTLRVIRTDGYVHLWTKTVRASNDMPAAIVEQLFTEMIASAREEDGKLLFASAAN